MRKSIVSANRNRRTGVRCPRRLMSPPRRTTKPASPPSPKAQETRQGRAKDERSRPSATPGPGSSPGRSRRCGSTGCRSAPGRGRSPCRNRSICPTSPIGSAGSSGCWRSWASRPSCRTTARRSRAASCSGGWPCSGGLPCSYCECPPASASSSMRAKGSKRSSIARSTGAGFVFGKALDQSRGARGICLRVPRLADRHLRRGPVRRPLSPGCDAVDRARLRRGDGLVDGHQRRRDR